MTVGNKYHAKKYASQDGEVFDSKREARRYEELCLLQRAGRIQNLRRQVKFILIPAQREPDRVGVRGGRVKGASIEREVSYIADFVYVDSAIGKQVVEDAKGMKTKDYVIKRKLMLWVHGIRIREV